MERSVSYNIDNVVFNVDGVRARDYGEGSIIKIEQNEDRVNLHVGAKGEYIGAVSNDKSATITLTLLQNSLTLAQLRELAQEGEPFPCSMVDMNDGQTQSAEHVWVQNLGDFSRGTEAEDVEVTLVAGRWE